MITMTFKSKKTGDALIPSKGYLRLWATKLAKESVADFIKEINSIDD